MGNRAWNFGAGLAAVMAVSLLCSVPLAGQTSNGVQTAAAPGAPEGNPLFSGIWRNKTDGSCNVEDTKAGCGVEVEGRSTAGASGDKLLNSRIVDPPDGKIPYQPWARARQQEVFKHMADPLPEYVDGQRHCYPTAIPRPFLHSPYQFVQVPGYVLILHENFHMYRSIPLDGRPHVGKDMKLWMGDSRGHWEGNTLVVDVTNFTDDTWFDVVGNFHSSALHIVERYTILDPDTIQYRATLDDPKVYTRPWTLGLTFQRVKQPGYELLEWACHEGERDSQHIEKKSD